MKLKCVLSDEWESSIYCDEETGTLYIDNNDLGGNRVPAGSKAITSEHGTLYIEDALLRPYISLFTLSPNDIWGEPAFPIEGGIEVEFI